jgi:hypothetical protein
MPEQDDQGRKWWQSSATLTAIATLITAIATLVSVLTGNGPA